MLLVDMTDNKMLQAILDGQSAIKEEFKVEIGKLGDRIEKLEDKLDKVDKNLTRRIDMIGLQLAQLEDDAPTTEELDKLEKRVSKFEALVSKSS